MTDGNQAPLRDRLKGETRSIILDGFAACLADQSIDQVTYADVAARSGVGLRTVYRHFPTREDLLRALYSWLSARDDLEATLPRSIEDLTQQLPSFFRHFDEMAPVVRAALTTTQGHEMRMAVAEQRAAAFLAVLQPLMEGLKPREQRMAAAALQHMHSASAWLTMHDFWGLDGEESAQAATWAIKAMLDAIRRNVGMSPTA